MQSSPTASVGKRLLRLAAGAALALGVLLALLLALAPNSHALLAADLRPDPVPPQAAEVTGGNPIVYAISLTKTVGTNPAVCATTAQITVAQGTPVYYCYTVKNTGSQTLDSHTLTDSQLGPLLQGFFYTLNPGATTTFTATTTPFVSVTNVATWTATQSPSVAGVLPAAVATDTATVTVQGPAVAVTKTVGLDPGTCATTSDLLVQPGTVVYYCFTARNTGAVNLIMHNAVDSLLGQVITDLAYILTPGATAFITTAHTATVSATNIVTWSAMSSFEQTVTATDTASVAVGNASISVIKVAANTDTCGPTGSVTVNQGANVWFCVRITNTGNFTFTQHLISDPKLGINVQVNLPLAPGATAVVSNDQVAALGPVVAADSFTNTVTVTSTNAAGQPTALQAAAAAPVTASATGSAAVTVQTPTVDGPAGEPYTVFLPLAR